MDYFKLATGITNEHVKQIRQDSLVEDLKEMVRIQEALIAEQDAQIKLLKEILHVRGLL